VRRPARHASWAAALACAIVVALIARSGTTLSRGVACAVLLCGAVAFVAGFVLSRRGQNDARRIVRQVIAPTDRALSRRALRAMSLVERTEAAPDEGSVALARLHFERVIEAAAPERVARAAARRVRSYRVMGFALGLATLLALGLAALRILEGFNVLVARGPRAPLEMSWLERVRITVKPPAYLRSPSRTLGDVAFTQLPRGTELTFRGRPLHDGRRLVVSDGDEDVPFVSDGAGGVVAHYTVEHDASLVVAARFGDVLIVEPDTLRVVALADQAPRVTLQGAPETLRLAELDRLELRWSARDDHGLKQIDLVLRSGHREERRTLSQLDGESTFEQGGHVLTPRDAFLRTLYLPVQVTIEARDSDPVDGSKWGESLPITLLPPAVGEPEARRYLALLEARDVFVDALAETRTPSNQALPDAAERLHQRIARASDTLRGAISANYGGLAVPSGVQSFVRGRLRVLSEAERQPRSLPPVLSDMILALDSLLGSLSGREARQVAKVLGDVAEEAAFAADLAVSPEGNREGLERLDKAIVAIQAGAEQLLALGVLGNDLGLVAIGDLGRVQRARAHADLFHAERAARHLAERLRRPEPSFGSSSSGGVEAGPGRGAQEPNATPSNADSAFNDLARAIAELAREHSEAVSQVDQTLDDASSAGDESLKEEAARRAQTIRDAVDGLPMPGALPGSVEAALAMGREQAQATAQQLERLDLAAAAKSGRAALGALDDALARGALTPSATDGAEAARDALSQQLDWLEQAQRGAEQRSREATREPLSQAASLEEELARQAKSLAQRGEQPNTPLPEELTERLHRAEQVMQDAARNLHEGKGKEALRLQREAQRLLEQSDRGKTTDPGEQEPAPDADDPDGEGGGFGGKVPEAEEKSRAEEFRKRVLKNLGEGRGQMAPAVKRYAEGLLR
jgi:hypothetical protein